MVDALPFIIPLGLLVLAQFIKLPRIKGMLGEGVVRAAFRRKLDPDVYRCLHDLTFDTPRGTTQIDHIVVSRFGVFVIETKNMAGWIFGSPEQARWTQVLHRKKTTFQNPIRQNYGHLKTVQSVLNLDEACLHNVVAFVGDARAKTPFPDTVLWSARALVRFIRSRTTPVISPSEVDHMVARLEAARLENGRMTRRAHVRQVRARVAARGPSGTACPNCGGKMVARTSRKTGEHFMGCESFPRCRGMRRAAA